MDLKLKGYDKSIFEIKKGPNYDKEDEFCQWYDVTLNIKNKYFNYDETGEDLLEFELHDIYNSISDCLQNKLKKDEELDFVEPDLEFYFYKADKEKTPMCELRIYLYADNVGYTSDYYSIMLDEKDMILIRDHIGKVLSKKDN